MADAGRVTVLRHRDRLCRSGCLQIPTLEAPCASGSRLFGARIAWLVGPEFETDRALPRGLRGHSGVELGDDYRQGLVVVLVRGDNDPSGVSTNPGVNNYQ